MLIHIRRKTSRSFILSIILTFVSLCSYSSFAMAKADIISAGTAVQAESQASHAQKVKDFLARADVKTQLEKMGVDPEKAKQRVAALSEDELAQISDNIDALPAGGSVLAIIGVVFLVLLILEYTGVTNFFTKV